MALHPSRTVLIGAGGLGTAVALGLVNTWSNFSDLELRVVDSEAVELSNLNRQVLFDTDAVGQQKAYYLSNRLKELYPSQRFHCEPVQCFLTQSNAEELLADADYVIDATDHSHTKFLINDFCVERRIAFCHGGALQYRGQLISVVPASDRVPPCLRCVFGEFDAEDCAAENARVPGAGILGPVAGMTGFLQAQECLNFFRGQKEPGSRLLRFSLDNLCVQHTPLAWQPSCSLNHGSRQ